MINVPKFGNSVLLKYSASYFSRFPKSLPTGSVVRSVNLRYNLLAVFFLKTCQNTKQNSQLSSNE